MKRVPEYINGIATHRQRFKLDSSSECYFFGEKSKSLSSGLDPAGPGFRGNLDRRCRLDPSDADFVDNIHTDVDQYGTPTDVSWVISCIVYWPCDKMPGFKRGLDNVVSSFVS